MDGGDWVKIHRKIENSDVWCDETALKVFLWCLINANWKPGKVAGVDVPRGSLVTSFSRGADRLDMPRSTFYKAVRRLCEYGCITYSGVKVKTGKQRGVMITICKYGTYQDDNRVGETQRKRQGNAKETQRKRKGNEIEESKKESKEESTPKAPRKSKPVYVPKDGDLPESLAPLAGLWLEWVDFQREDVRKPMTQRRAAKQIQQLADMGLDRARAAINHSIAGGFQGIYEPRESKPSGNGKPRQPDLGLNL